MASRHEFRVTLDGIDLSSDVAERISRAIQRAALTELAGVDLKGDFAARIFLPGQPEGMRINALTPQQIEQLRFQEATE